MKRIMLGILIGVTLAGWAHADEKREKAEEAFFRGYYLEFGKRDLIAAQKTYQEFIWDFESAPDLWLRAHLGMARIATRTGEGDAARLIAIAEAGAANPDLMMGEDVRSALRQEIRDARDLLSRAAEPDPVAARIQTWLPALSLGPGNSRCLEAEEALAAFGTKVAPALMVTMRSSDPIAVGGAARILLRIGGSEPVRALIGALEDMDVAFPVQITIQLRDAEVRHLPVFAAAFDHPLPEVREAAVKVSTRWLAENGMDAPEIWDRIVEATEDSHETVRLAALNSIDGSAGTARRIQVAAAVIRNWRQLPAAQDPAIRVLFGWPLDADEITEDLHEDVLDLLDCGIGRVELLAGTLALRAGGDLPAKAIVTMLEGRNPPNVNRAALAVAKGLAGNRPIIEALTRAAERVFLTAGDEDWKITFDNLVFALTARAELIRSEGLATLIPLLTTVSKAPGGQRREYALNRLLGLLRTGARDGEYTDQLLAVYQSLTSEADRVAWLEAFGDRLDDTRMQVAWTAAKSRDPALRLQGIEILVRKLAPNQLIEALTPILEDEDGRVRCAAIKALSPVLPAERLGPVAARALQDRDIMVRHVSVAPLVRSLGEAALPALLEAAAKDPSILTPAVEAVSGYLDLETVREFTLAAIAQTKNTALKAELLAAGGNAITDEMILRALETGNPQMIRRLAPVAAKRLLLEAWPILLAQKRRYPEAENALWQIRDYYVSLKEYRDIRETRENEGFRKAALLAESEDPVMRVAAAYALGALGKPQGVSLLLDLVGDEDQEVREAALSALRRLGSD
jgi:HEAT repeat protein